VIDREQRTHAFGGLHRITDRVTLETQSIVDRFAGAVDVGMTVKRRQFLAADEQHLAIDFLQSHHLGVMARRAVDAAARRARGETIGVPVNRTLGIGAAS
jgi:hypothetical protein